MTGAALQARLLWRRNEGLLALYLLLAALLVLYAVLFPGLLSVSGIARFTQNWFPVALVAVAQTLVMLAGGIDLAIGATVSLGTVIAASLLGDSLGSTALGQPRGPGGGGRDRRRHGLDRGAPAPARDHRLARRLVHRRRPGAARHAAARRVRAGLVLRAAGRRQADGTPAAGPDPARLARPAGDPLGHAIGAAGDNPQGAFRSGIDVVRARIWTYTISGALSALAGLYVAAQTGAGDPVIGNPLTLDSIAAAVLGGVGFLGGQGTLRGAVAGSLLLAILINVMFFMGFPPVAQYVAKGLIIVGAMALRLLKER